MQVALLALLRSKGGAPLELLGWSQARGVGVQVQGNGAVVPFWPLAHCSPLQITAHCIAAHCYSPLAANANDIGLAAHFYSPLPIHFSPL